MSRNTQEAETCISASPVLTTGGVKRLLPIGFECSAHPRGLRDSPSQVQSRAGRFTPHPHSLFNRRTSFRGPCFPLALLLVLTSTTRHLFPPDRGVRSWPRSSA